MSVANPPIIVTSIYNPAFFEASAADSITQAQANALYLKKTSPDTATALETFNAGIATTTAGISGSATVGTTLGVTGVLTASSGVVTSNVNTGASTTLALGATDTIELGCGASRGAATVSIATAGTGNVNISNAITNTVRLFSSSQGTNHQFDNINLIDTASGAMSLFNTQVGGALNIGTSATRTGAINIGKSGGTHLINIDTSSTSATAIQIGTSASAKTVKINNSTGSVHLSSLDIQGTGLNNVTNGTGNVSIGNLQTSGDIDIGCSSGRLNTGGINIGNIGTGGFVIDVGHAASSTSLNGTTTIANLGINAVNRTTNGLLEIGTGATNTTLNISRSGVTAAILGALSVATTSLFTGIATMTAPIVLGSVPTVNTQVGFLTTVAVPASAGFITSGTPVLYSTITVPAGNSIISTNVKINSGDTLLTYSIYLNNSTYGSNPTAATTNSNASTIALTRSPINITNGNIYLQLSVNVSLTASTTYNLYALATYVGNAQISNENFFLNSIRIG